MANQEHLDILMKGVEVCNQWRKEHPDTLPDLSYADLIGVNLNGADLSVANLSFANLIFARINHAILVQTDLRQATLTNCEVYGISVWDVSLAGANQSGLIITDRHQPRFYVEFGGLVDHSNDPIITVDD